MKNVHLFLWRGSACALGLSVFLYSVSIVYTAEFSPRTQQYKIDPATNT